MKCDHVCKKCSKHEDGSWADHAANDMIARSLCFSCNLWTDRIGKMPVVIDGWKVVALIEEHIWPNSKKQ